MPQRMLRIGIDFDDVLIKSAERSIELYNKAYGTSLGLSDWYEFSDPSSYAETWGSGDISLLVKRVVAAQADENFSEVEPIENALQVLRRLKDKGHSLFVITGRPENIRSQTATILNKYYEGIFTNDQVFFVDHYNHDGQKASKADVALNLGLTHFVEDLPDHADALSRVGIKTVLFSPGYKWNESGFAADAKDNGIVLVDWIAIGKYFEDETAK